MRPVDPGEAEQTQRGRVQRPPDDIGIFQLPGLATVLRGRRLPTSLDADEAQSAHGRDADGYAKIDRILRLHVDQNGKHRLRYNANRKRDAVPKQRLHKRYVDVERKLVVLAIGHTGLPL